jgi:hypothetical protein
MEQAKGKLVTFLDLLHGGIIAWAGLRYHLKRNCLFLRGNSSHL